MLASSILPSHVSAQTADEAKETALSFMTQKKGGAVKLSTINIGKSIAKVKGKGATAADNAACPRHPSVSLWRLRHRMC